MLLTRLNTREKRAGAPAGFGLLIILVVLFLLLAVAFSLSGIAMKNSILARQYVQRKTAEVAAIAAAKIAFSDLQYLAGTDACATANVPEYSTSNPDDFSSVPARTGVWQQKKPPHGYDRLFSRNVPAMLVSNFGDASKMGIFRFPKHGFSAPFEFFGKNLRFAYHIEDFSQKASIRAGESEAYLEQFAKNAEKLCDIRQLTAREIPFERVFERAGEEVFFEENLRRAYDFEAFFAHCVGTPAAKKSLVLDAIGVPANFTNCELRVDFPALLPFFPEKFLMPQESNAFQNPLPGVPVSTTLPQPQNVFESCEHFFPLISEIKLHLGFFNPRSDGQHRARFHITARIWNPFPFPLLAHADAQLGLLDFVNMPSVVIGNKNTGAEFSFSLSNFPAKRFGLVRQTPSDATCNAHCRIFDASEQGFSKSAKSPVAGLHPGEIFLAVFPNPAVQPAGLARNSGGETWKFQKNPTPSKPPAGTIGNRWFHADHAIEIYSLPNFLPTTITLRHYNGSFPQNKFPHEYAPETLVFKNIVFPQFSFTLRGEDYNRATAGDYAITQANLVFSLRMKTENPSAMKALFEACDWRSGIFDFAQKEVADAFEISVKTLESAQKAAFSEDPPENSYFWDKKANAHDGGCAQAIFFDVPRHAHLSAGTLRHAHHYTLPAFALGLPASPKRSKNINSIFDGVYAKTPLNPRLSEDGNAISGAFNINSEDARAWALVLSNRIPEWEIRVPERAGTPKAFLKKTLKNVFFRRPFSAQFTCKNFENFAPKTDEELEKMPQRERESILLVQGFRSISDEKMDALGRTIAKRIRKRRTETGTVFQSIAEFADSGMLENAIADAGINTLAGTEIPAWFPSALTQGDLLQTLALYAFPRGDTFRIIARAELINPLTHVPEAVAGAEIIAQRTADFFDASQTPETPFKQQNALNRTLGRRFKIINIRLLAHDEL